MRNDFLPLNFAQRTISLMVSRLRFTLLLPLAALLACGSNSPSTGGTSYTITSGDYVFVISPSAAGANMLNGALTVVGSTVTGTFQYTNPQLPSCTGQTISLTGSANTSNVLTLTSSSFSGSVATFTLQLPLSTDNTGTAHGSGTAVIAGGSCALASSPLQAQLIPSFSGNWTVTLTSPTNGTDTLSITEAGANQFGQFAATGTLSGSTLNGTATLSGLVIGGTLQLADTSSTVQVTANASALPVSVAINGATGTMTH